MRKTARLTEESNMKTHLITTLLLLTAWGTIKILLSIPTEYVVWGFMITGLVAVYTMIYMLVKDTLRIKDIRDDE